MTNFVLPGRPGQQSVVVADSSSGLTITIAGVGPEYDGTTFGPDNASPPILGVASPVQAGVARIGKPIATKVHIVSASRAGLTSILTPHDATDRTFMLSNLGATSDIPLTVTATGVLARAVIGTPAIAADARVTLVGQSAPASVGAFVFPGSATVALAGQASPANTGIVRWIITDPLIGVASPAQAGNVGTVSQLLQLHVECAGAVSAVTPADVMHISGVNTRTAVGIIRFAGGSGLMFRSFP